MEACRHREEFEGGECTTCTMRRHSSWHHEKDPHGVIPSDFSTVRYRVLGFSSPAGTRIKNLMVRIKYIGGGETTLNYLTVLKEFLNRER